MPSWLSSDRFCTTEFVLRMPNPDVIQNEVVYCGRTLYTHRIYIGITRSKSFIESYNAP